MKKLSVLFAAAMMVVSVGMAKAQKLLLWMSQVFLMQCQKRKKQMQRLQHL